MDPPRANTSTPLSRDRIVEAALKILETEQLSSVTMRRVAAALSTGPASLYAHVANKDELHALMFDRVVGDIDVPEAEPARWMEQAKGVIRSMCDVMVARPGIAAVAIAQIPIGPQALRVTEGLIAILRSGGLADKVVGYAVDLLPLYATAIAQEVTERKEEGATAADYAEAGAQIEAYFASLPGDRFPNILSMAGAMSAGDREERFEFGLDILIGGLAAYGGPARDRA
ncbi:MAG: TetR/AcrR family transcriptional regulator [Geodermatophilaceae bacterium]|nr:TetR/AcrR family transcriptional regulator [Geodermatophilaceae bacterium]